MTKIRQRQILFSRYVGIGLLLSVCFAMTACGGLPSYSDNNIETVHLIADDNVNENTPVAVDVVYIFDESLVQQIEKITARQWFAEKHQYQLQYPGKLAIFNYEFIPVSQAVLNPENEEASFPEFHQLAYKVMLYANYLKKSKDFTLDITPFEKPLIRFTKTAIVVKEQNQ